MLDEAYVMNLLGHLKLASDLNPGGSEEYTRASFWLRVSDATTYLWREAGRELIPVGPRSPFPLTFGGLRSFLDGQFAADESEFGVVAAKASADQIVDSLFSGTWSKLARRLGLKDDDVLDYEAVVEYAERWDIDVSCNRRLESILRDVARKAEHQIGRAGDLLQWVVDRLLGAKFCESMQDHYNEPAEDWLRAHVLDPTGRTIDTDVGRAFEFGYGMLGDLAYAALDRLLLDLQNRLTRIVHDDLREYERVCPGTRRVIELRVGLALELQGGCQAALNLLLEGTQGDEEDVAELGRRLPGIIETLADWENTGRVAILDWLPAAEGLDPKAELTVEFVEPTSRLFGLLKHVGQHHLLVRVGEAEVVRIRCQDAKDEPLLKDRLPEAFALTEPDAPLHDRLLASPVEIKGGLKEAMKALAGVAGKTAIVGGPAPPHLQRLLATSLELMNPQPFEYPEWDFVGALENTCNHLLPEGDTLFQLPRTLNSIALELESA